MDGSMMGEANEMDIKTRALRPISLVMNASLYCLSQGQRAKCTGL